MIEFLVDFLIVLIRKSQNGEITLCARIRENGNKIQQERSPQRSGMKPKVRARLSVSVSVLYVEVTNTGFNSTGSAH